MTLENSIFLLSKGAIFQKENVLLIRTMPVKVLLHVWSYGFYDTTLSTEYQRRHMMKLFVGHNIQLFNGFVGNSIYVHLYNAFLGNTCSKQLFHVFLIISNTTVFLPLWA